MKLHLYLFQVAAVYGQLLASMLQMDMVVLMRPLQ